MLPEKERLKKLFDFINNHSNFTLNNFDKLYVELLCERNNENNKLVIDQISCYANNLRQTIEKEAYFFQMKKNESTFKDFVSNFSSDVSSAIVHL